MTTELLINPPPQDRRCEVCGKHVNELKPFGKAGDPLVGDFDGAILVKTFRAMCPKDKELDKELEKLNEEFKLKHYEGYEEKLIEIYGEERASQISFYQQLRDTIGASWECRDCICLDEYEKEYWELKKNE